MLITIVQAEIELAIKNYINTQVNLKEGQEISIDLRATRGAEGATAIIDIYYPETREAAEASHAAATEARKEQLSGQQNKGLNIRQVPQDGDKPEPKEEEKPAAQATPAPQEKKDDHPKQNEHQGQGQGQGQGKGKNEGDNKPGSTGKSIFAGLNRPNNNG